MKHFLLSLVFLCFTALPVSTSYICNNAWMNVSTVGTGSIVVTTALSGAQTIEDCGITNGQTADYRVFDSANWEVGTGVYTTATDTLTRVVTESSNADAAISLSGSATVIITPSKAGLPGEHTPIDSTLVPASDYFLVMEGGSLLERALIASQLATTTEQLTGTATDKMTTPDSVAALWEKGANEASAATVSFGEGYLFHITGTTTITDFDWDTPKDGRCAMLIFDGAVQITHNATTLKVPGNASRTTSAGDRAIVCQDSSDNVFLTAYEEAAEPLESTVNIQVFTANGTYTPTANISHAIVTCTGAGGGGGGADTAGGSADVGVGGGGGGGATAIEEYSAATLGASQTVTIGVGGNGGSATNGTDGAVGDDTTFGSLMTAGGGLGGTGSTASAADQQTTAGAGGGTATGGDANIPGNSGGDGTAGGSDGTTDFIIGIGGMGGSSVWGGGGRLRPRSIASLTTDSTVTGSGGIAFGGGGGGGVDLTSATGAAGGAGQDGICVIQEFML